MEKLKCLCCEEENPLAYCIDCMNNESRLHWKWRNLYKKKKEETKLLEKENKRLQEQIKTLKFGQR